MFGLNWLDLVIIGVLLFGLLDGIYKGFIMSFLNIAGLFISLYLSRFLMGYAADFIIKNTNIFTGLKSMFHKRIEGMDFLSREILKMFHVGGGSQVDSVTIVFIDVACFIVIFIFSTIVMNIFKNILKSSIKKTPLKHIDKLLGAIIGFSIAALFVFLFFAILIPLSTIMQKNNSIAVAIEGSKLAKYFFYFNFIIPWLQKANGANMLETIQGYLKAL